MGPKIVRARSDSALLPLTIAGTAVCFVAGWFLGAWVFKPAHGAAASDGASDGSDDVTVTLPAVDAGAIAPLPAVVHDAGPSVVMAPMTVNSGFLSACGDGEEMNLAGPRCDAPAGLEAALRTRLQAILGACPSAMSAAREPSRALSLGLRVDFVRHRVVSLLGRSSSVPDKVSYVPCVNNALGSLDNVWRITAAHPRYEYFFTARFGPLRAPAATPTVTPTPVATPITTPAPAPAASADAGAIDPTLPTAAQMLRMPAMAQGAVAWTIAIVRETPRAGPVVGRVPQNTPIEIVDRRGSWYGIRWMHVHTGWTYADAIGQSR